VRSLTLREGETMKVPRIDDTAKWVIGSSVAVLLAVFTLGMRVSTISGAATEAEIAVKAAEVRIVDLEKADIKSIADREQLREALVELRKENKEAHEAILKKLDDKRLALDKEN
jgi:hypothetical protein